MRKVLIHRWMQDFFLINSPPLLKCYLFGSFVTDDNFNDVDTILIFNKWEICEIIRDARIAFNLEFHLNLHTQIFHESQNEKIANFIRRAKFVQEVL